MSVDRLTASTDGLIELDNPDNEIRSIERILAGGEIAINDSQGDLTVAAVDSPANNVRISTAGSMLLAETAVTAIGAATTLTAGRGIFDRDNTSAPNIQTGRLQLNAGEQGIGSPDNPVDVVVSDSVGANTTPANGNISLANLAGALPLGLIDAGVGDVNLTAQTIDDATSDALADIVGGRLIMKPTTESERCSRLNCCRCPN